MASGAHGPKPGVFGSPTGSALFANSPVFMQETFLCRRELTIRNEFRNQFDQYHCPPSCFDIDNWSLDLATMTCMIASVNLAM